MSSASSRRAKRASANKEPTLVRQRRKGRHWYEIRADGSERRVPDKAVDWSRADAMTEAEMEAAARSDPDAKPFSDAELKRMKRVPAAKVIRRILDLSQEEFARAFGIPIGTLRDWEQGRVEPDQAARSYLKVIAHDPDAVRKALEAA